MGENDAFIRSIKIAVDQAKVNLEEVVITTGIKILAQLVDMSPVGNPDLWQVNAHNTYARETFNLFADAINNDPGTRRRVRRMGQKKLRETFPSKAPDGYTGGRFRGNWQVGIDECPSEELDRIDKSGDSTKRIGNMILRSFRVGMKDIYFVNNLPYAYLLEFGHSKQAPNGMVRVTALQFSQYLDDAAREVKNR